MNTKHLIPLLALSAALQAGAGPGHDHGADTDHAATKTAGVALPRFAATSDLFELVGVLEGRTLTLYLDRATTNEPLPQADIELEFAGAKFQPQAQADGSFVVELAAAPGEGVHAVTATVTAGDDAGLLAAELDLHGAAHDEHPPAVGWKRWSLGAGGGLLGLALLAGLMRVMRRRSQGGAA